MSDNPPLKDPDTHRVLGAAFEVHRLLGCGFLEQVYQDALAIEFADRGVEFERELIINVRFKNRVLQSFYRPDFVCYGGVIIEVKAGDRITPVDMAQMINYLKVAKCERGLILAFGARSLVYKRVAYSEILHRLTSVSEEAAVED